MSYALYAIGSSYVGERAIGVFVLRCKFYIRMFLPSRHYLIAYTSK